MANSKLRASSVCQELNCFRKKKQSSSSSSVMSNSPCMVWYESQMLSSNESVTVESAESIASSPILFSPESSVYVHLHVDNNESKNGNCQSSIENKKAHSRLAMNPPLSKKGLARLMACTKFTRVELQRIYRAFKNEFPQGTMNADDFTKIFSRLFPNGDPRAYSKYIFNTYDEDKDGLISFDEYVLGISMSLHGSKERQLKWAFRLYDIDNDGYITKQELSNVIGAIQNTLGRPTISSEIRNRAAETNTSRLFEKLDTNKDGVISQQEFVNACLLDESITNNLNHFAVPPRPSSDQFELENDVPYIVTTNQRRRKIGTIILADQRQTAKPSGLATHWRDGVTQSAVIHQSNDVFRIDDDFLCLQSSKDNSWSTSINQRNRQTTV